MSGPSITVLPAPTVIYDFDVTWPLVGAMAVGAAFQAAGNQKFGSNTTYTLWDAPAGAGTNNMALLSGAPCGQFVSTGAVGVSRSLQGFSMLVPLAASTLPTGVLWPSFMRVYRWQFVMAMGAASNSGLNCNMSLQPAAGAAPGLVSQNNTGLGICGSAVNPGKWAYFSRHAAGAGVDEVVELNIVNTVPTLVDMVVLASTPGAAAVFQLYLNGNYNAPVVQRPFGTLTMPSYAAPANAARLVPQIESNDNANPGTLQIAAMRCMAGQFQVTGGQV